MSVNSCLSMRHDYNISGWFCWKCNTVKISWHTRTENCIRIYLIYANGQMFTRYHENKILFSTSTYSTRDIFIV
jgi:hypothetical protein